MEWEPRDSMELNEQKKEYSAVTRNCFEWVEAVVTSIVVVVLLFTFLFRVVNVNGQSMEDTIHNEDKVLLTNLFYEPENGDVVVISRAQHFEEPIIKRVIATGGQTVDIDFETGAVYVDGTLLEEDYINELTFTDEGTEFPLTLGEGEIFVMGDNRNHSTDSRDTRIGAVDTRYVVGRAVALALPGPDSLTGERDFSRIGLLH